MYLICCQVLFPASKYKLKYTLIVFVKKVMIGLHFICKFLKSEACKGGEKKDIKGADQDLRLIYRNVGFQTFQASTTYENWHLLQNPLTSLSLSFLICKMEITMHGSQYCESQTK